MRILLSLVFVTFFSASSVAQGLGYAAGGPSGASSSFGWSAGSFHLGGGGEVVAADHVGLGGEIGFFDRLIVGSANATFHVLGLHHSEASPFVTAGYTRLGIGDGEGTVNAYNVGVGAHVWAANRVGIRVEVRDQIRPDRRGAIHYWSARVGVAFR